MKINEVVKITGLTKKAISYYEDKELVCPLVNPENGYREYSDEEVNVLKIISALRSFGFTVKDIKKAIDNKEDLKVIISNYVNELNNQIMELQRNKVIINNTLEKLSAPAFQLKEITQDMMSLKSFVEMGEKERENFMEKSLLRIFPGAYGKYLSLFLNKFLQEPLDSEEKNNAWIHVVQVLDNSSSISITKKIEEYIDSFDDELWQRVSSNFQIELSKYINTNFDLADFNFHNIEFSQDEIDRLRMFLSYFNSEENIKIYIDIFSKIENDLKVLSREYRELFNKEQEMERCAEGYFESVEPHYEDKDYYEVLDKGIKKFDDTKLPSKVAISILEDSCFIGIEINNFINKKNLNRHIEEFREKAKNIKSKIDGFVYVITGIDALPEYINEDEMFSTIIACRVKSIENRPKGMKGWNIPGSKRLVCRHKGGIDTYHKTFDYVFFKFLERESLEVSIPLNIEIYTEESMYFLIAIE